MYAKKIITPVIKALCLS